MYVILRELHKWETDHECLATCEDLVNILIRFDLVILFTGICDGICNCDYSVVRTEEEIGADDLLKIDIPEHLTEKFNQS